MALQMSATTRLNLGLRVFFSEFVRVSLRHPGQALFSRGPSPGRRGPLADGRILTLKKSSRVSMWEVTALPAIISYFSIRPHLGSEKNDFMYLDPVGLHAARAHADAAGKII